ncbi:DUF2913 family protein [Vibrio sp. WJH972]
MTQYYQEIQNVVNQALEAMEALHQQGKLIDAPNSNKQFLVRWVTKAIKDQRFDTCVARDLISWQKMGRSQGNGLALEQIFKRISKFYAQFFTEQAQNITDANIEAFLDLMESLDWEVSTSEAIVGQGKVQIYTEGQNSLALCADQCDSCFDGENLVKPMSFFVRGNHAQFVEQAGQSGFMLHKRTDYKSNVKYHGEYLIFPSNQGKQLAEIPLSFNA